MTDLARYQDSLTIQRVLHTARTIAIVGLSGNDLRASQFGVINEEGARIAEDGDVTVIMDRCLKVEHARYAGRMHWLGFNTQRITSVRSGLQ